MDTGREMGLGLSAMWGAAQSSPHFFTIRRIKDEMVSIIQYKRKYMKDLFVQIQEKVTQAMNNLDYLIGNKQCNTLHEQVCIANCKNDLVVVQKMLDYLIEIHSGGKIDAISVLKEYYRRKSERCIEKNELFCNDFEIQNVFLSPFKNRLN